MALYLIDPGKRFERPLPPFGVNWASSQARGLGFWAEATQSGMVDVLRRMADATLQGGATPAGAALGGLSIRTDGSGDYAQFVNAPPIEFYTTANWTIDLWFFHVAASSYAAVFDLSSAAAANGRKVCLFIDASDFYVSVQTAGLALNETSGTNPFVTGRWEHLAVTRDGTAVALFRNGVHFSTRTLSAATGADSSAATDLFLGLNRTGGGTDFNGAYALCRGWDYTKSPADGWALYDPATRWDLYWVPGRRVFFDVAAAGGSVITPGVGSLIFTGKAPSLFTAVNIATGKGSAVYTGKAPALSTGVNLSVDKGSVVLTGKAPSLSTGVNIATGKGALVLTGLAPSLQRTYQVSPSAGSVVFTGQQPTVSATTGTTISPSVGSVVLTGKAPTLFVAVNVATGKGQLTYTGKAPTVQSGQLISTSAGSLVYNGKAPTVQVSYAITVGAGRVIFTGKAPTISGADTVSVGKGSVVFTGQVPSLSTGLVTQPSTGQVTYTGKAPSLQTSYAIGIGCGSLVFAGKAPTSINSGVLISTLHVTGNYAPTVHLSGNYRPTIHVTGEYQ